MQRLAQGIGTYLKRVAQSGPATQSSVSIPRKLYRVSEIASHVAVTRQTIHNYVTIGLITEETRTEGGQRLFDESVFHRLAMIQDLKRTHRLQEMRSVLDSGGAHGPAAAPQGETTS